LLLLYECQDSFFNMNRDNVHVAADSTAAGRVGGNSPAAGAAEEKGGSNHHLGEDCLPEDLGSAAGN
jgi:hypothetical protein